MFDILWSMYGIFSIVAAVYIVTISLWRTRPQGIQEIYQELKSWLCTSLYINKVNITIEQVIIGTVLLWPTALAGFFYLIINVLMPKK